MIWLKWFLILIVLTDLWIRFSPTYAEKWHIDPVSAASLGPAGFATTVVSSVGPEQTLDALVQVALETPRTKIAAGSVGEGRVTFVTRSLIWGFPDFTTVSVETGNEDTQLTLYGRIRFGWGDSGVNKARIASWLKAINPILK